MGILIMILLGIVVLMLASYGIGAIAGLIYGIFAAIFRIAGIILKTVFVIVTFPLRIFKK